jgi:ribosomal protein S18 acetylase RimI-like enzyme
MNFDIRFATADDVPQLAEFIVIAGAGLFEQMFDGLIFNLSAREAISLACVDEGSSLHYSNAVVADAETAIAGVVLGYPAEQYKLPGLIRALLPRKRLAPLQEVLAGAVEGTWYVNTLTVAGFAQGRGLASSLLGLARTMSEEQGLNGLSLHAWGDNEPALALYRSFGFVTIKDIPVPRTSHLHHDAPMLLMHAPAPR